MNPIVLWFNKLGSPPNFHRYATRWMPWYFGAALLLLGIGVWGALFRVPADYQQGDSYRILFIHVPCAWMSLFVYVTMAVQAAIALVWRIKLCEILAMACAPIGAAFTAITLATGSIWGRPMWGTWWDWDPRLTSELVLLFLYIGVIALDASIEDRRRGARAAGFLALIGLVNLPIIHYSVQWWNSLHQGSTISLLGPSKMDASMILPLLATVAAMQLWFVGSLLSRARTMLLEREAGKAWARDLAGRDMSRADA
jgi:heme exporter protein C